MKNLLIIRLDGIGDYILFRNFIEILTTSKRYSEYRFTLLCNKSWYELSEFLDSKYISNFISFEKEKYLSNPLYKYSLEHKLDDYHFDIILHPTYSRSVIADNLINSIQAKKKIGYDGDFSNITIKEKNLTNKFYTRLVKTNEEYLFEFERNKLFFEEILSAKIDIRKTYIDTKQYKLLEPDFGKYIVFVIGAQDENRKYAINNYAQIANWLVEKYNINIVLCGSINDSNYSKCFAEKTRKKLINLAGLTSLTDMLGIINHSLLVLSNDTGLAHMTVALNKICIIISNGNHFGRFVPYSKEQDNSVTICPFDYSKNINKYKKKYYYGSDLDINTISYRRIINRLKIYLTEQEFIDNNAFNIIFSDIHRFNQTNLTFSKNFNSFFIQIEKFKQADENYILYGNGTISKIIQMLIPDKITGYVDINDDNNHPSTLKDREFDMILITVLGREKEVIDYLSIDLGIKKEQIVSFKI